ncbi:MAG: hypothetical protein FWC73_08440 [Defluviitaleaceae bacterium]|nr:hypothetical protein [Defluviitaleaceae bacterium]
MKTTKRKLVLADANLNCILKFKFALGLVTVLIFTLIPALMSGIGQQPAVIMPEPVSPLCTPVAEQLPDVMPKPISQSINDGIEFTVLDVQIYHGVARLNLSIQDITGKNRISEQTSFIGGSQTFFITDYELLRFEPTSGTGYFSMMLTSTLGSPLLSPLELDRFYIVLNLASDLYDSSKWVWITNIWLIDDCFDDSIIIITTDELPKPLNFPRPLDFQYLILSPFGLQLVFDFDIVYFPHMSVSLETTQGIIPLTHGGGGFHCGYGVKHSVLIHDELIDVTEVLTVHINIESQHLKIVINM